MKKPPNTAQMEKNMEDATMAISVNAVMDMMNKPNAV